MHALSLVGTAQPTHVYGCVVFDLSFINEVTNNPETIFSINAKVLLKLGVIEESKATEWSQVHLVPKPYPNEWRFTLDFVRLNACTGGLEGWPIPNILKVLERIGKNQETFLPS